MDGNNMGNGQNNGQNQFTNHYQDNTANIPYQQMPNGNNGTPKANGLQITGLVLGILAIVSCCCYGVPAVIFGIAGLVCSILGNKNNKHGIGLAGLICSIIGLILGVISTIYFVAVLSSPEFQFYFRQYMREFGY